MFDIVRQGLQFNCEKLGLDMIENGIQLFEFLQKIDEIMYLKELTLFSCGHAIGRSGMGSNFKNRYTHVLRIYMQKKKVFPQAGVCVRIGNLVGKI